MDTAQPSLQRIISSTWHSIEHKTRRTIVLSGLFSAVLATLDAVAVGLVPTLVTRFQASGGHSRGGLLGGVSTSTLGITVAVLFVAKSVLSALVMFWQSSFLARDEGERTIALFRRILMSPYGDTAARHTATFIRDLHVSIGLLYRGAANSIGLLIADFLGLVGLLVIVIIRAPLIGVTLSIFLLVAARVYSALIRAPVHQLSIRIQDGNNECLNELTESFGGLKTLKAFRVEGTATRRFAVVRRRFSLMARDSMIYTQVSRYYLDIATVVGVGFCLGAAWLVGGRTTILISFGLLVGVAARAMPSLSRVLTSLTNIKVAGAAVLDLEPELHQLDDLPEEIPIGRAHRSLAAPAGEGPATAARDHSSPQPPVMGLDGVTFRYPAAAADVLHDVSLDLRPGELVAIVGETGAGKTTLVDVLVGLLAPERGVVRRNSDAPVGYVAQETFVWDETIRFNVAMDRPPVAGDVDGDVWASLEAARLADWVRGLTNGLETRLGERGGRMSGGQRQRLGLARAMYGHPSVLLLDEPTSALDGDTSRALMSTLAGIKRDMAIIVVTHDPIVVEFADRTITLDAKERGRQAV